MHFTIMITYFIDEAPMTLLYKFWVCTLLCKPKPQAFLTTWLSAKVHLRSQNQER